MHSSTPFVRLSVCKPAAETSLIPKGEGKPMGDCCKDGQQAGWKCRARIELEVDD
jgi:hypothetical protein